MSVRLDCEEARSHFPELLGARPSIGLGRAAGAGAPAPRSEEHATFVIADHERRRNRPQPPAALRVGGTADSAARDHVLSCRGCAEELAGLAAVLEDTVRLSGGDVPDPGPDYWDALLPAVRARIAARASASAREGRLWGAAAAAALLAAAGLAALLGSGRGAGGDVEARISGALEALSALPGTEALLIPGLDPEPFVPEPAAGDPHAEVGIEEILEAMEDLSPPAGGFPWDDEPIQWLVEELNESEAARLAQELEREHG